MSISTRVALALGAGLILAGAGFPALAFPGPSPAPIAEVVTGDGDAPTPEQLAKLADVLAPALVRVEYTLRYDKGDAPGGGTPGWQRAYRAALGQDDADSADYSELIRDERPLGRAGYLLADGRVVTADPCIHPRFIAQIAVRAADKAVPATIDSYAKAQGAVFLKASSPIAGGLTFDGAAPGPHYSVSYVQRSGAWTVGVGSAPSGARAEPGSKRRYTPASDETLIVDGSGKGVGMSFTGELPIDGSWKGSPSAWPGVSAVEMDRLLADLDKSTASSLPRVAIRFRSPRQGAGEGGRMRRFGGGGGDDSGEQTTEWNGTGILVDPTTVVVLADFKPKLTARLESIRVFGADAAGIPATFVGTLKDHSAFIARLSTPASGPARLGTGPVTDMRDALLLKAEIGVLGEVRTAYLWHERVQSLQPGWRGHLYPAVSASRGGQTPWDTESYSAENFLFDLSGALVAAPVSHREKVASEDRMNFRTPADSMLPGAYLAEVIKDASKAFDPENRPLSESEEDRLAWLGVEFQPMDPDLARVNKVVDQTAGGRTGAMVTYLYPDSPATKAGIEVGDILLRLHVQGQPKPLDVQIEAGMSGMFDQIWANYDRMPDEYLDQIPQPWGSAENALTRALTDIGFGTPFTADIFRDGKVITKEMAVTQGPAHYKSAAHFKSEPAGITVRDLTYEVRRYFQLRPEDPGVIISKIEKGGRAAIAGLKPYEIITAIDDQPVKSIADVEKALSSGAADLRLNVKRMTEGRIVKLKIGVAEKKDAPK